MTDELILETVYELKKEIEKLRNEVTELKSTIDESRDILSQKKEEPSEKNNKDGYIISFMDYNGNIKDCTVDTIVGFYKNYKEAKLTLDAIVKATGYCENQTDFSVEVRNNIEAMYKIIPIKHN